MASAEWPRYLPAGDAALVVEFGDRIDKGINRQVHVLVRLLAQDPPPGLGEAVPTYRSLLVHYDPLQMGYDDVTRLVRDRLRRSEEVPPPRPRTVEIPTVYGGEFGPDLPFVAEHNGLAVEEVIHLHSSVDYPVYMLGFTPGFPYLGGMPTAIAAPRLETPRPRVPAGSVGLAGQQTGIYPIASPGGWRIIGRTPMVLFDPHRDPPALLAAGDRVRFVPIPEAEFKNDA